MAKSIKVTEDIWKKLTLTKIELKSANMSDVLEIIIQVYEMAITKGEASEKNIPPENETNQNIKQ